MLFIYLDNGFGSGFSSFACFTPARTPAFQVTRWKYFTFSLHKAAILVSVSLYRVCLLCFASALLFCAEPILYAYATDSRLRGCGKEGRCGELHSSSATPLVLAVSDNMQKQIYTSVLRVFVCDPLWHTHCALLPPKIKQHYIHVSSFIIFVCPLPAPVRHTLALELSVRLAAIIILRVVVSRCKERKPSTEIG